ncbi:hypothetical protein [Methanohalobium sp.]|uniref:hypothetical protein n=1 Tax=Methanohalobium sp. TaxID=2837493 RepID=UPI0025E23FC3|nr:hypothetical protein [Methanohalobium sp.]
MSKRQQSNKSGNREETTVMSVSDIGKKSTLESSDFSMTVEDTWSVEKEDGVDYYCRHTVTDETTGINFTAIERNPADGEYCVFVWDSIADVSTEDWVNITGFVVSDNTPDVDSINQKLRVKLNEDAFLYYTAKDEDELYIDVTIWESASISENFEVGDEFVLQSAVIDDFSDRHYVSVNSASEMNKMNNVDEITKKIRTIVKFNGEIYNKN